MGSPKEQYILVDSHGDRIELDDLVDKLRKDEARVLADDSVGVVIYVGDLGLYELTPIATGGFLAHPVTQISQPRFSSGMVRRQIGARVVSVTADSVFIVRDGDTLRKVRGENLKPGMLLATGEKVFR